MVFLLCLLLIELMIPRNICTNAENDFASCSSEVELTIEKKEQNEETIYSLNCKSTKKPFDESAEFLVDDVSREHILIIKDRCYDSTKKECSVDYCECKPTSNEFTVKFKIALLQIGQTFGCLFRIRNDATGHFLKIYTSNKFNGTEFTPDECNIKVIGRTSISSATSTVTIPTVDMKNDVDWTLIVALIAIVPILILMSVVYCKCKKTPNRGNEQKKDDIETRPNTAEDENIQETVPLTEKPQEILMKTINKDIEIRPNTAEDETIQETIPSTQNPQEILLKTANEMFIKCIEIRADFKNLRKPKVLDGIVEKLKVFEEEFDAIEQKVGSASVLSNEIHALQMELKAMNEEKRKAYSTDIKVDDYFAINPEHDVVYFHEKIKVKQRQKLRKERILDMCFIENQDNLFLVYIDADNKHIVRQNIKDETDTEIYVLNMQPNRLSKINDETIAVIYKKRLEVLVFNVKDMKEEKTKSFKISENDILESHNGIQGILALSEILFIMSNKMHLYVCLVTGYKPKVEKLPLENMLEFDTARRLTHAITSDGAKDVVFIADENDKNITSIDLSLIKQWDGEKGSIAEVVFRQQKDHGRDLQNVRGIAADQSLIYAATSAGISVFKHDNGLFPDSNKYIKIVEYEQHVEHTRGLCLQYFQGYPYVGLSCVIKQKDVILVFKLKK